MTTYRGQDGAVRLSTETVWGIRQWEAHWDIDPLDATILGDAWRTYRSGHGKGGGRLLAFFDYGDTAGQQVLAQPFVSSMPDGALADLTLVVQPLLAFTGTALLLSLDIVLALGSLIGAVFTFAWTATPTPVVVTGYTEPWEYAYSGTESLIYTETWGNLTQWTSHGAGSASVASNRLHLTFAAVGTEANVFPVSGLSAGVLQGTLTSTVRSTTGGLVGGSVCGLMCLANQADMSHGAGGTGYAVLLRAPQTDIVLVRIEDGIPSYTVLASSTGGLWTNDTDITLGLRWDASASTVAATGGVVLTALLAGTPIAGLLYVTDLFAGSTVGEAPLAHRGSGSLDAAFANTILMAVP